MKGRREKRWSEEPREKEREKRREEEEQERVGEGQKGGEEEMK